MISLLGYYSGSIAALDIHLHLDLGVRMGTECKGMYGNRILVDGKQWELYGMHHVILGMENKDWMGRPEYICIIPRLDGKGYHTM